MTRRETSGIVSLLTTLAAVSGTLAQPIPADRAFGRDLGAIAPSGRVSGPPGEMRLAKRACRNLPGKNVRGRIVDLAVQEWGFFGFEVVDETSVVDSDPEEGRPRRNTPWLSPEESARVAKSIAGYWSITPEAPWILERQNAAWNEADGVAAEWRDPWSAAFVSWVMCESGLGEWKRFQRAIAHHAYIDQAIEARDRPESPAAFVAFDVGHKSMEPGDLLCSTARSAYRSIAQRRRSLGTGMRAHCDIVVRVEAANQRVLAIGGNVRGAVSMKLLPAVFPQNEETGAIATSVGRARRMAFAHLKLRADPIEADALEGTATIRALRDQGDAPGWLRELPPTP